MDLQKFVTGASQSYKKFYMVGAEEVSEKDLFMLSKKLELYQDL